MSNYNGEGTALLEALDGIIRKTAPDRESMRELIKQIVAERLPRTLEVRHGELPLGTLEEHTRPEFDPITKAVFVGVPVLMVGPAGCGKTHLAGQIAKALNLRFAFIPLTAGVSESRLIGRFCPIGENGRFEYVPAPFVDFYENGGLFLLDELDAADPNVMLTINAALANGHLETPNPAKPLIARHPDFRCIAAANTFGHGADRVYVGRNQLDAATLDRFRTQFALDYDVEFEKQAGHPDLVAWAHELRQTIRERSIRRLASTRMILDYTRLMNAGFTLAQVQAMYFLDWSANEKALVGW